MPLELPVNPTKALASDSRKRDLQISSRTRHHIPIHIVFECTDTFAKWYLLVLRFKVVPSIPHLYHSVTAARGYLPYVGAVAHDCTPAIMGFAFMHDTGRHLIFHRETTAANHRLGSNLVILHEVLV